MATLLKQSTAVTVRLGPFLDKADGVTEKTALTPVVEVSKNHGAFAARSSASAVTADSNGWYGVPLDATDTGTLGPAVIKSDDSATYLPVWHDFLVVPANTYDALVAGTDTLQADLTQINGSATAATNFEKGTSTMVRFTVAASSTTTVVNTSDLTEATNDHYKDRWLLFITGALAGQAKQITAYNGTTKAFTVGALTEAPATSDTGIVV